MVFNSDLTEVLDELARGHVTGALHCKLGRHRKVLYLVDGVISAVDSTDPADDLCQRLLCERRVGSHDLSMAQELAETTSRAIVDILIELSLIDNETLEYELMNQARDAIRRMLRRHDLEWSFIEDALPDGGPAAVSLEWSDVIGTLPETITGAHPAPRPDVAAAWELVARGRGAIEGGQYDEGVHLFRRAETLAPNDPRIPLIRAAGEEFYCSLLAHAGLDLDTRLELAMPPADFGDVFRPACYRLLGSIDGQTTVAELLTAAGGSHVDSMKALLELVGWGVVQVVGAQPTPAVVGREAATSTV